jgi:hypothetical protein
MKSLRSILVLATSISLLGCVQARKVTFDESAFVPYGHFGSATIKGTAFTVLRDNKHEQVAVSKAVVKLVPANAYTDEIVTRRYFNRVKLEQADPRYAKYVRRTHPDDDGHFVFSNLPAGSYYVSCHLHWSVPDSYTDADGITQETTAAEDQWVYSKVSVAGGQTVDVEDWVQGK